MHKFALCFATFIVAVGNQPLFCQKSVSASAQQATRDAAAAAIVQRAVDTLGGSSSVGQVQNSVATGSVQPLSANWHSNGPFTWKDSGDDFRYESTLPTGPAVLLSNQGIPVTISNNVTTPIPLHVAMARFPVHLPAIVLLRDLNDLRYSLKSLGNGTFKGRDIQRVEIVLSTDRVTAKVSRQEWQFDANTGLPLRVEYRLPDSRNASFFIKAAVEFSDFRPVSGVQMPFQLQFFRGADAAANATLSSIAFNQMLSPADFQASNGGGQ